MNKPMSDTGFTFPTSAESVAFKNGMIVTADDLHTAMTYPIQLMQAVNRAVYGCGVVCGFKLGPDPELCERPPELCDPCKDESDSNPMVYANSILEIGCGTAMDCAGLPIELCKPVRVELSPETCGCDGENGSMCVLIRRVSGSEAPRGDCCSPAEGAIECSRSRDHVEIRAFPSDALPDDVCMRDFDTSDDEECVSFSSKRRTPEKTAGETNGKQNSADEAKTDTLCDCLIDCGDCCGCCGDGWVLLGCVKLCDGKIIVDSLKPVSGAHPNNPDSPYYPRKWIKTIECQCGPKERAEPPDSTSAEAKRREELDMLLKEREIEVQIRRDDRVYEKIEEIVPANAAAHRKLFRAMNFRNLEHFAYVLETQTAQLSEMQQFARNSEKLKEYLAAAQGKAN